MAVSERNKVQHLVTHTRAALPENNKASAELTTASGGSLLRAQPNSVANHVTARSISD